MNRQQGNKEIISVNWPAWSEVGMAVDNEVDFSEAAGMLLEPLNNENARIILAEAFRAPSAQLIGGIINRGALKSLEGNFYFTFSDKYPLSEKYLKDHDNKVSQKLPYTSDSTINLTEVESELVNIWGNVLGLKK